MTRLSAATMRAARCLALALCVSGPLLAADARALFRAGTRELAAGNASEAVKDFDGAYAEQPSASLLFYLGEAHRAAGHKTRARHYYKRYLHDLPAGPKAAEAKQALAALKESSKKKPANAENKLSLEDIELTQPAVRPAPRHRRHRAAAPPAQAAVAAPPPALALPAAQPAPALPAAQPALALPAAQPAPVVPAASAAAATTPPPAVAAAPAPAAVPAVATQTPAAVPAVATAGPAAARPASALMPAPMTPAASPAAATPGSAHTGGFGARSTPGSSTYVSYTARLLVVNGNTMKGYATALVGDSASALYTHGIAFGKQTAQFKNAVYVGFGTEIGPGTNETLQRYELSWQFAWAPLGSDSLVSPHLGLRAGGMMFTSNALTQGSMSLGAVFAPEAGLDLNAGPLVITAGLGYDLNLGKDLGPNASLSGYALDLGASIRF